MRGRLLAKEIADAEPLYISVIKLNLPLRILTVDAGGPKSLDGNVRQNHHQCPMMAELFFEVAG